MPAMLTVMRSKHSTGVSTTGVEIYLKGCKTMDDQQQHEVEMSESGRPLIDTVIQAIEYGEYDGAFNEIKEAMDRRREARKESVLSQVKEVFGENAEINVVEDTPLQQLFKGAEEEKSGSAMEMWREGAQVQQSKLLSGPYRIDPKD